MKAKLGLFIKPCPPVLPELGTALSSVLVFLSFNVISTEYYHGPFFEVEVLSTVVSMLQLS